MRTTVTIDDDLWRRATELTGTRERTALIRQAFETLIAVEAGRRLGRLGASDLEATAAERTRELP